MGSAGTEWETADTFLDTRLNQKTQTIGNSNQLNSIATTYPGQAIYPLDAGNGWLADRPDSRDAANTKWHYPQLRVGSAGSIGSVSLGGVFSAGGVTLNNNSTLFFHPFTLPTTEKFYKITSTTSFFTVASGGGGVRVQSGIDIYDSTTGYRLNVALSNREDSTIPTTYFHRCLIPGGSTCGIWYTNTDSSPANTIIWNASPVALSYTWSYSTGSSSTPYTQDTGALSTSTTNTMVYKVNYQGYY